MIVHSFPSHWLVLRLQRPENNPPITVCVLGSEAF